MKYTGPALADGFKQDVPQICDILAAKCNTYNAGNVAVKNTDQATDADTRKRALVNVVGAEINTEGEHKIYEKIYQLPNDPGSGKQTHAAAMVWQGTDYHQVPESETLKLTARLVWAHSKFTMKARVFPTTRYYAVWEIPIAGQEGNTMYSPVRKEETSDEDDIMKTMAKFLSDTNFSS